MTSWVDEEEVLSSSSSAIAEPHLDSEASIAQGQETRNSIALIPGSHRDMGELGCLSHPGSRHRTGRQRMDYSWA